MKHFLTLHVKNGSTALISAYDVAMLMDTDGGTGVLMSNGGPSFDVVEQFIDVSRQLAEALAP